MIESQGVERSHLRRIMGPSRIRYSIDRRWCQAHVGCMGCLEQRRSWVQSESSDPGILPVPGSRWMPQVFHVEGPCWMSRTTSGSCWILDVSFDARFLLDASVLSCGRFLLDASVISHGRFLLDVSSDGRFLLDAWLSRVTGSCWTLDISCAVSGSCWILDILSDVRFLLDASVLSCGRLLLGASRDVRFLLDLGRLVRWQVLVGCFGSLALQVLVGPWISRALCQVLVGSWTSHPMSGSCWMPRFLRVAGSCWILDVSSGVRFLLDACLLRGGFL